MFTKRDQKNKKINFGTVIFLMLLSISINCSKNPTTPENPPPDPPDTTAPTINSHYPGQNAVDVSISTSITVTFSEAIDTSSITEASFNSNPDVPGSISVSANIVNLFPA